MNIEKIIILLCTLAFLGCSSDVCSYTKEEKVETIQLFVESKLELRNAYGAKSLPCIIVKEDSERYALPRNWIKDFEYEEGYEYILKIRKVTPPYEIYDAPQSFYYFLETISKKEKK